MPEETTPSEELPPDGVARRLDRLERLSPAENSLPTKIGTGVEAKNDQP
jgi:hypothetical protein